MEDCANLWMSFKVFDEVMLAWAPSGVLPSPAGADPRKGCPYTIKDEIRHRITSNVGFVLYLEVWVTQCTCADQLVD